MFIDHLFSKPLLDLCLSIPSRSATLKINLNLLCYFIFCKIV